MASTQNTRYAAALLTAAALLMPRRLGEETAAVRTASLRPHTMYKKGICDDSWFEHGGVHWLTRRRDSNWTPSLRVDLVGGSISKPGIMFYITAHSVNARLGRRVKNGDRVLIKSRKSGQKGLAILWRVAGAVAGSSNRSCAFMCGRWDGCPVSAKSGDWRVGDRIEIWGGQPQFPVPRAYAGYARQVVNAGSRQVGVLHLAPQLHLPGGSLRAASKKGRLLDIASSQEAVYRFLCRQRPRHIFVEGCMEMLTQLQQQARELASRLLHYKHTSAMTEPQRLLCAKLRATVLYAALHQNVVLHAADELAMLQAHEQTFQKVRHSGKDAVNEYAAMEMQRELHVKKLIQEFFVRHPGESSVLVYGAMHHFVCMEEWPSGPRVVRHLLSGFNPDGNRLRRQQLQFLRTKTSSAAC